VSNITVRDQIVVSRRVEEAWDAIQDPRAHVSWHPYVKRIEGEHELGASRKCEVRVGKRTGRTEERCVTCQREQTILWMIEKDTTGFSRMVSDWRAGFRLESKSPSATIVTAESTFRPERVSVRLMTPLIVRKFHRTQRAILAGLKQYCENPPGAEGRASSLDSASRAS
jgi:hypothetical protein